MKYLILLGLLLSGCSTDKGGIEKTAVITEYGLYGIPATTGELELPVSNTGVLSLVEDSRPIEVTQDVPAKIGVTFGYCYDIYSNEPEFIITRKLTHPKMTKPDGSESNGYEYERSLETSNGIASYCTNYTFEYEWEVVKGLWDFSIEKDGRRIINQKFYVQ